METLEKIDSDINLGDGYIVFAIKIDDELTAQIDVKYDWEWNHNETKRIVNDYWCQNTELFKNGTEIPIPAWQSFEVTMFVHSKIDEEYIENLINE